MLARIASKVQAKMSLSTLSSCTSVIAADWLSAAQRTLPVARAFVLETDAVFRVARYQQSGDELVHNNYRAKQQMRYNILYGVQIVGMSQRSHNFTRMQGCA